MGTSFNRFWLSGGAPTDSGTTPRKFVRETAQLTIGFVSQNEPRWVRSFEKPPSLRLASFRRIAAPGQCLGKTGQVCHWLRFAESPRRLRDSAQPAEFAIGFVSPKRRAAP